MEEQVREEFMGEMNFTGGKKKNWQEKDYCHFRIWLLYLKFKECLLIFKNFGFLFVFSLCNTEMFSVRIFVFRERARRWLRDELVSDK